MKKTNKLFTKLSTIVVSLAMALGVGVAAASNGGFKVARADDTGSYTFTFDANTETSGSGTSCTADGSTALTTSNFATKGAYSFTASKVKYYWLFGGSENVKSVSSTANCYPGKNSSLKVGKGAGDGTFALTINGADGIYITSVEITAYGSGNTAKITIDEATNETKSWTLSTSSGSHTFEYNSQVDTITLTGGAGLASGNKMAYITEMVVNYSVPGEGEEPTYSVFYNSNTNETVEGMPSSQGGLENGTVQALSGNPTRWGYAFGGWATTPEGTTPVNSVTIDDANITVYAIWNEDHTVPGKYSDNPYTVSQAKEAVDSGISEKVTDVYAMGIVSGTIGTFSAKNGYISYNISADGSTEGFQLQAYHGKGYNGANFVSADDIQVGDEVVIKGNLVLYESTTYEFAAGNQLFAGPTFYSVTDGITGGKFTEPKVRENNSLAITIVADEHFTLPETLTSVTMGGEALSAGTGYTYDSETGEFSITSVTGAVVINGACVEDAKYTVTYYSGEHSDSEPFVVEEKKYAGDTYTLIGFGESGAGFESKAGYAFEDWLVGEEHKNPGETITIAGDTTITATYSMAKTFAAYTSALTEGDYVIYYSEKVMKNTISNNRLGCESMTATNDKVVGPDPTVIWHIAPSATEGYWTIYNAATGKYAASNDSNNQAQLLADGTDSHALWSVELSEGTYEFTNKARSGVNNKFLRNNGTYGFAVYANSTGGKLSLFKYVDPVLESISTSEQTTEFTLGQAFTYGGILTAKYTINKLDTVVTPKAFKLDDAQTGQELTDGVTALPYGEHTIYVFYEEGGVTKSTSYQVSVVYEAVSSISFTGNHTVSLGFATEYSVGSLPVTVLSANADQGYEWVVSANTVEDDFVFENNALLTGDTEGTITLSVRSTANNSIHDDLVITVVDDSIVNLKDSSFSQHTGDVVTIEYDSVQNMGEPEHFTWSFVSGEDKVTDVSEKIDRSSLTFTCDKEAKGDNKVVVQLAVSNGNKHAATTAEITIENSSSSIIDETTGATLYLGTAENIVTFNPTVGHVGNASEDLSWTVSPENQGVTVDKGVVTASNDANPEVAYTVTAVTTATAYAASATKTYNITVKAPDSIKVTAPTKTNYELGEQFDKTGFAVKAVFGTDDNALEKDAVGYNEPNPDMTKEGEQTITISLLGKSDSFKITITKYEYYTKLTDASQLKAGDEILVVATKDTKSYVMKNTLISSSSKRMQGEEVAIDNKGILKNDTLAAYAFRLVEKDGKWALMTSENKFVSSSSQGNMVLASEPVYTSISVSEGKASIAFDSAIGKIMYNGSSNWFTTYTSNTMIMPEIYVIHGDGQNPDIPTVLKGISVTTMPTKTTYEIGDELDTTGLVVTATYSDGTTKPVTNYTLSKFNSSEAGEKTIVVKYSEDGIEKSTTFKVTVNEAPVTVTGIAIKTQPTKVTYEIGESINLDGLTIEVSYSDDTKVTIRTGFTTNASSIDMSTAGTKTITVTYEGKTATLTITVNEAPVVTLLGINVTTDEMKTTYNVGDEFDATGLVVTAKYSDGSSEVVTNYTLSQVDMSTAGTKTITVTYEGKTATFTIAVNDSTQPGEDVAAAKTAAINTLHDYMQGLLDSGEYDTTGRQQLGQEYDKGIVLINSATTIAEVDTALTNAKALLDAVAKQGGGDTPEATLESIAVTTNPTTTTYTVGDEFKPDGLVITATYSDGSTKTVTGYTLSTVDMSTAGTKTITVTYNGKTATFTITVNEAATDPLEEAKTNAINELDAFVNSLNRADYSDEAWAQIQSALQEAKTAINNATDASALNNLVAQVKATINAVKDNLELAKAAALEALEQYYNSFDKNNYDATGVANLTKAYNDGKDAIEAATTTEGVAAALANAKAEMDKVQTKSTAPAVKRCGGDIAATSVILSAIALAGVGLLVFKKRKQD